MDIIKKTSCWYLGMGIGVVLMCILNVGKKLTMNETIRRKEDN